MRKQVLIFLLWASSLVACQSALPTSTTEQTAAYPAAVTPTVEGAYPEAIPLIPTVDNGSMPESPTAVDGNNEAPAPLPQAPVTVYPLIPLSNGEDISQPGTYTVQIVPLDTPYMVRAKTETNQVDVALAGLYVSDLGNPMCNTLVKDRLDLLTNNPAATFSLRVYGADVMHPGAVIATVIRHDNIDIGLDLVASGYAILVDFQFDGFETYKLLRDTAQVNGQGMWSPSDCQFSPLFLQGQSA